MTIKTNDAAFGAYPSSRQMSPKVKTFVEHLQKRMTPRLLRATR